MGVLENDAGAGGKTVHLGILDRSGGVCDGRRGGVCDGHRGRSGGKGPHKSPQPPIWGCANTGSAARRVS